MKTQFVCALVASCVLVVLGSNTALAAPPPAYSVHFDKSEYVASIGQPIVARVRITPPPANGLFSFGIQAALKGDNLTAADLGITVPAALNFHTVLGAGAITTATGLVVTAKGSVDFHKDPLPVYQQQFLALITIGGLPRGNYTLSLSARSALGAAEQIFVDATAVNLDPFVHFKSSTTV